MRRLPLTFESDDRRIIARPFMPGGHGHLESLFDRIGHMSEDEVEVTLQQINSNNDKRHTDLSSVFSEHFQAGSDMISWSCQWSRSRRLLAGAYMTMEYAVDSAALFNPSIVPHPDQGGVGEGAVRFIMSLRATGEGHISSIVFRTGVIGADHVITMNPVPAALQRARVSPDRHYIKHLFGRKLDEMSIGHQTVEQVLSLLPEQFSLPQLHDAVEQARHSGQWHDDADQVVDTMEWLARTNYEINLPAGTDIAGLVIFPISEEEVHGIEDLRLTRFIDNDGSVRYFGTYTAFNGYRTVPIMISTSDFYHIEIHSLNGACARNKGMALFPRRIDGHFAMCSRIDGENLYISFSDYVHFWESATQLAAPTYPWELMQVGNCGYPLETPEGWLLLTHGVGPMRTYCIGAMLLDLKNPLNVIGQLRQPLISPVGDEREGYVPNVVYSCGAMIHHDQLYLPYAQADKSTSIAAFNLEEIINRLLASPI